MAPSEPDELKGVPLEAWMAGTAASHMEWCFYPGLSLLWHGGGSVPAPRAARSISSAWNIKEQFLALQVIAGAN